MKISEFAKHNHITAKMLRHYDEIGLLRPAEVDAIANGYNEQVQKRLQIDRLIQLIEAEGFRMDRSIQLMELTQESVHELKKNMPNTEMFLEQAQVIVKQLADGEAFGVLRVDLCQFKSVNDIDGFEIGDKVIPTNL